MAPKKITVKSGEELKLTVLDGVINKEFFGTLRLEISVEKDAKLVIYDIQTEEDKRSNSVIVNLKGENAIADLYGLYLLTGESDFTHSVTVNHLAPNCQSSQICRGILDCKASGHFSGTVHVTDKAAGTKATQESRHLLLSENAKVDFIPSLEIFTDDVECSHGATSGQIDEETLFYMRSRGISVAKAKELLTYAFAKEVIDKIELPEQKEFLKKLTKKFKKDCLHIYS